MSSKLSRLILSVSLLSLGVSAQVEMRYSNQVPGDQQAMLREDLQQLSFLPLKDSKDGELRRFFKIGPNFGLNAGMENWLKARVKYVVGEYYMFGPTKMRKVSGSRGLSGRKSDPGIYSVTGKDI